MGLITRSVTDGLLSVELTARLKGTSREFMPFGTRTWSEQSGHLLADPEAGHAVLFIGLFTLTPKRGAINVLCMHNTQAGTDASVAVVFGSGGSNCASVVLLNHSTGRLYCWLRP